MSNKKAILFFLFVGVFLLLTNGYSLLKGNSERIEDILDYIGLLLGIGHIIYVGVFIKKTKL